MREEYLDNLEIAYLCGKAQCIRIILPWVVVAEEPLH